MTLIAGKRGCEDVAGVGLAVMSKKTDLKVSTAVTAVKGSIFFSVRQVWAWGVEIIGRSLLKLSSTNLSK